MTMKTMTYCSIKTKQRLTSSGRSINKKSTYDSWVRYTPEGIDFPKEDTETPNV